MISYYDMLFVLHEIVDAHGHGELAIWADKLIDDGNPAGNEIAMFLGWQKFDWGKIKPDDLSRFGQGIVNWLKRRAHTGCVRPAPYSNTLLGPNQLFASALGAVHNNLNDLFPGDVRRVPDTYEQVEQRRLQDLHQDRLRRMRAPQSSGEAPLNNGGLSSLFGLNTGGKRK